MPRLPLRQPKDRARAWATALVFLLPLLSLATDFAIGLAGFLFLLTALCWWRPALRELRRCWPGIRWVVLAFATHLAVACVVAVAGGRDAGMLDAPARMLLAISAMLVVRVAGPPACALWLGAAGGALAGLGVVAWQAFVLGIGRPGGYLNPITFGDFALCLSLLCLAGMADGTVRTWVMGAGAVCGLAASLLTGSRGGWVVLPAALALLVWRGSLLPRRLRVALPLLVCTAAALATAVPQTGVRARLATGFDDLRLYGKGDPSPTSLGVRLELWRAGWRLVRERPWAEQWLGQDTPTYKGRMRDWVAAGSLSPAVFAPPEPPHLHNDALQALVTRGLPGLLAWCAILAAPLYFFGTRLRTRHGRGPGHAAAFAGVLFVLAYAGFGLSEVIFWSMKGNVFYALTLSLLMGWCLDAPVAASACPRTPQGKDPGGRASRPEQRATGCASRCATGGGRGTAATKPPRTLPRRRRQ
jgi:O-antigen ligase